MAGDLFVFAAVVAVAVLLGRLLTARLGVPDAAAYVVFGVAVGLLPGLPTVQLTPDVVLLLFLPPLIYFAAFFSDPRETAANFVPVIGQSVGLVLATAAAAAGTLLLIFPDVGWAAAIAFGAAIAPPDPVAATTVLQRLGVPRRLVTVLEGEGLVNDGVALTLFALAVEAVGSKPTGADVAIRVVVEVGGGIGIGLVVGIAVLWLRKLIRDTPSQIVLSLATPYVAFLPASHVHASGVLATVTAAAWLSTRGRGLFAPTSRLQTETFWRVLNQLLVALLFVLLGVQVPGIVAVVGEYPIGTLLLAAAALVAVAVTVRLAWMFILPPLMARLHVRRAALITMPRRERVAMGWCGPRGAVSLAVALSIPVTTATGAPFPRRDLLLFLTVVVVLATLVGQVMTLPLVLRKLKLSPGERERTEGLRARRATVEAALSELDTISAREEPDPRVVDGLRQIFELRRDRLASQADVESDGSGEVRPDARDLRLRLLEVERRALRRLYDEGKISGRTRVEVSQDLDLDETQLRGVE